MATPGSEPAATSGAAREPSVRALTEHDRDWLDALSASALSEFAARRGGEWLSQDRRAVGSVATFVGCLDGEPVGVARAVVSDGPAGGPVVVEWLYVEPATRGAGVGRALLDAAVAWGRARGCRSADVSALPGDRATKSFLEGAGFKARLLVMNRSLEGGGSTTA